MGVTRDTFYEHPSIAIMPMGFCYPGKGKSGDLPPRKECAAQWHRPLLEWMPQIELTLVIGQYAQKHYLPGDQKTNLTEMVKRWKEFLPEHFPLPHPSPRNNIWLRKNPWFEKQTIPSLQQRVGQLIQPFGKGV
jgi:uracil-DNA glycosylase